jgi:hypothetical protein
MWIHIKLVPRLLIVDGEESTAKALLVKCVRAPLLGVESAGGNKVARGIV